MKLSENKEKLLTNESDIDEGVACNVVGDYMQLLTFEYILNDTDDSKFDQHIGTLIAMEDVKQHFRDDWNIETDIGPKGKSKVAFGDEIVSPKVDPKGKLKVDVGDERASSKMKSKFEMDVNNFLIPRNKLHVDRKVKSNAVVCEQRLSSKVISDVGRMVLSEETSKNILQLIYITLRC